MSQYDLFTFKLIAFFFLMSKPVIENEVNSVTVGLYGPDRYEGLPEICLMPMDMGYCRAKVKRYYFDIRRMKCSMFYWGGCAGNDNNFNSIDECNDFCVTIEDGANSVAGTIVTRQSNKQKLGQQQHQQQQQQQQQQQYHKHQNQHQQQQQQQQLVRQQLQRQQKLRDLDFIENNQYTKYAEYDYNNSNKNNNNNNYNNRDRSDNSYVKNTRGVSTLTRTSTTPKYTAKTKLNFKETGDLIWNGTAQSQLFTSSTKNSPIITSTKVPSNIIQNSNHKDFQPDDNNDDNDDDYDN